MRTTPPIQVDKKDLVKLSGWAESVSEHRLAQRARIVLLSADGFGPTAIARELGCTRQTVVSWRERYRTSGITGLVDAARSGRPTSVSSTDVLLRTLRPPPLGYQRWSSRILGAELGIGNASVAGAWRAWGIRPTRHGGVCLDTDPPLDAHVARVRGLFVASGVGALVLECGPPGPDDATPVERRRDVGDLPGYGGARPHPAAGERAAAFIRSLVTTGNRSPMVILVGGAPPWWGRLGDQHRAMIHVAGPDRSWPRLVRVVCLMAGAHPRGAASVTALCAALRGHEQDAVFSWPVG